ncbi:hypothetical protein L3X38_017386 [Prunus dulcis]|uniref:Uncharacterized protein n=1 Tax=Prunus dulcis TaxID=3755 RepID=A0AAD4VJC7_PRUDU|nr:hypothetical protein L3X38_035254 [Prunus dulcis]KAI5338115.1 hypothetical protein L3X38_017386 [Prunus dulcis]
MFDRSWAVSGRTAFYKIINMHADSRKVKRWPELRFCLDGRFQFGLDWTRLGRSVLLCDFKCSADLQIDAKVGFWQSFMFASRFVRPFEWAELQLP